MGLSTIFVHFRLRSGQALRSITPTFQPKLKASLCHSGKSQHSKGPQHYVYMSDEEIETRPRKTPGGSKTTVVVKKTTATSTTTVESKKRKVSQTTAVKVAQVTKTAVQEKVSDDTIVSLEQDTMGTDWYEALAPEFQKPYFSALKKFLKTENQGNIIYPPFKDVYSWSRLTPLASVKVVIIGQDPYHGPGQAHGLSFSVLPPTKPPPSLKNIYKQIQADYPSFVIPTTGDLTPIAKQGVLWLNMCLTVRAAKPASHAKKGWEGLTSAAIKAVTSRDSERGVVFLAWGSHALKAVEKVDKTKHLVLHSVHPSPLSANKGFLGNEHFKKANEWIRKKYGADEEIDWTAVNSPQSTSDED